MKQVAYSLGRGIDSQIHFLTGFSGVVMTAGADRIFNEIDTLKVLLQRPTDFSYIEDGLKRVDEAMHALFNAESSLMETRRKYDVDKLEKRCQQAGDIVIKEMELLMQAVASIPDAGCRMFMHDTLEHISLAMQFFFRTIQYLRGVRTRTEVPLDLWDIFSRSKDICYRLDITPQEQQGVFACALGGVSFVINEMDTMIRHSVVKKTITGKRIPIKAAIGKVTTAVSDVDDKIQGIGNSTVTARDVFDAWHALVGTQNNLVEQVVKVMDVLEAAADEDNGLHLAVAMLNNHTNVLGYGLAALSMMFNAERE